MTGSKIALLVIDVQRELFNKGIPIFKADELLQNINTLVARAHKAGALVVYVQHSSKNSLIEGSDGWQLHPEIKPASADLMIRKQHGNAFEDTPLGDELAKRGMETLVICGLVTHGCVKATALGGIALGYKTVWVANAHSSYSKDAARLIDEWNEKIGAAGAQVAATRDVEFGAG